MTSYAHHVARDILRLFVRHSITLMVAISLVGLFEYSWWLIGISVIYGLIEGATYLIQSIAYMDRMDKLGEQY